MGKSYRDLIAWQKATDLVMRIYRITAVFPRDEVYGLASQLRRAAVSIPSNIAEGQGRRGVLEFKHFLGQARGSLMELETQVLIALRLIYVSQEVADNILRACAVFGKILNGLMSSLK